MTYRFPRFLNTIEAFLFEGLGPEEAGQLRAAIDSPPVDPGQAVGRRRGRPGGPRRRGMTVEQAKALQAQTAAYDAEMGAV